MINNYITTKTPTNEIFNNIIYSQITNPLQHFVTPVTPYFICNHYISTELDSCYDEYIGVELDISANNLLKNENYDTIQNFDIIMVQVNWFDYFIYVILPILHEKNKKIVLITSQWHLPQICRNEKTDSLLINPNILLWISQNPIYSNNEKYMSFPFGFYHNSLQEYILFIQTEYYLRVFSIKKPFIKKTHILNQHTSVYSYLPDNHIRKKYDIFGCNSGKNLPYADFLRNILNSEFVFSPTGDRDDCYRHYECIGLDAIPISNVSNEYMHVFGENMIYSNCSEMLKIFNTNKVNYNYNIPNKDILTVLYWYIKIQNKISKLKNMEFNKICTNIF